MKCLTLFTCYFCLVFSLTSVSRETVIIVADDDYPPYSYSENGEPRGIYIELLKRASIHLEPAYKVKIETMPWKRALSFVEQGNAIGIVPPYQHKNARPYISSYSVSLGTEFVVTFCREQINLKSALTINNQAIEPLHLGMNAGYLLLEKSYKNAIAAGRIKLWENKSTRANIIKLLTGKLDCYINDRGAILYELSKIKKSYPEFIEMITEQDEVRQHTAHIGYSRDTPQKYKNDFIKKMDVSLINVINK